MWAYGPTNLNRIGVGGLCAPSPTKVEAHMGWEGSSSLVWPSPPPRHVQSHSDILIAAVLGFEENDPIATRWPSIYLFSSLGSVCFEHFWSPKSLLGFLSFLVDENMKTRWKQFWSSTVNFYKLQWDCFRIVQIVRWFYLVVFTRKHIIGNRDVISEMIKQ